MSAASEVRGCPAAAWRPPKPPPWPAPAGRTSRAGPGSPGSPAAGASRRRAARAVAAVAAAPTGLAQCRAAGSAPATLGGHRAQLRLRAAAALRELGGKREWTTGWEAAAAGCWLPQEMQELLVAKERDDQQQGARTFCISGAVALRLPLRRLVARSHTRNSLLLCATHWALICTGLGQSKGQKGGRVCRGRSTRVQKGIGGGVELGGGGSASGESEDPWGLAEALLARSTCTGLRWTPGGAEEGRTKWGGDE